MKLKWKLLFIILLLILTTSYCSDFSEIPLSENEAYEMLVSGEIDQALFDILQQFYREPISVPNGDLKKLKSSFPKLLSQIPSSLKELLIFEPWARENIIKFYTAYPELEPLSPILSFETQPKKEVIATSFSLSKLPFSHSLTTTAKLDVSPIDEVEFSSSFAITDSTIYWSERTLYATITQTSSSIEVGNFSTNFNSGVSFGYFPTISYTDKLKTQENWLYGKRSHWNGVSLEQNFLEDNISLTSIYHNRPSEEIVGGGITLFKPTNFSIYAKASQLSLEDDLLIESQKSRYVHSGAELTIPNFLFELHSSVHTSEKKGSITATIENRSKNNFAHLSFSNVSVDSLFIRSSISHYTQNILSSALRLEELEDSDFYGDISNLTFKSAHTLSPYIRFYTQINYSTSKTISTVNGEIKVRGKVGNSITKRFSRSFYPRYFFSYRLYPSRKQSFHDQRFTLNFTNLPTGNVPISLNSKVALKKRGVNRTDYFSSEIDCKIIIINEIQLRPFISFDNKHSCEDSSYELESWLASGGVELKFSLFKKEDNRVLVEIPLFGRNEETLFENESENSEIMKGVRFYARVGFSI
jgi:hypothetical protein